MAKVNIYNKMNYTSFYYLLLIIGIPTSIKENMIIHNKNKTQIKPSKNTKNKELFSQYKMTFLNLGNLVSISYLFIT